MEDGENISAKFEKEEVTIINTKESTEYNDNHHDREIKVNGNISEVLSSVQGQRNELFRKICENSDESDFEGFCEQELIQSNENSNNLSARLKQLAERLQTSGCANDQVLKSWNCDLKPASIVKGGKLKEYAQYLGLQPTVKFKCYKCLESNFQSLQLLNDHLITCDNTADAKSLDEKVLKTSTHSTNFRVTRKVFLCSACGTYYENWNLFLHMKEVHNRFICLYCLGMFSHLEKLSSHLVSKHSCVPAHFKTQEDFSRNCDDPCFLMCYKCETLFTESDEVSEHICSKKSVKLPVRVPLAQEPTKVKGNVIIHQTFVKKSSNTVKSDYLPKSNGNAYESLEDLTSNEKTNELESSNLTTINSIKDLEEVQKHSEIGNNFEGKTCSSGKDSMPQADSVIEAEEMPCNMQVSSKEFEEMETKLMQQVNSEAEKLLEVQSKSDDAVPPIEERRVPKVTLKIPPASLLMNCNSDYDSDDSDRLEIEEEESSDGAEQDSALYNSTNDNCDTEQDSGSDGIVTADENIQVTELSLDHPLDKYEGEDLLRTCLTATAPSCAYCNHVRKIAVNGKQLGLHAIAEHRFSATVNSITQEELTPENFVARIKECLTGLEHFYFNLEKNVSNEEKALNPFDNVYECFHCRFMTPVHKELYLHNRKLHAKSVLLCIMCKSNFYSYSELICHLCPGVYVLDENIKFRCCMCRFDDFPSAFRLMVHLRKKHHACDVCLELCNNQSRLSNHVWKHKLHHLCYRCGIAYRNKPDITKHLFWKHGTESVLCKRCLQKKWPHVYHFCIPPSVFVCEECGGTFTKAVSLKAGYLKKNTLFKVHKRIHLNEKPHACTEEGCTETFISKKLLAKHIKRHYEPQVEDLLTTAVKEEPVIVDDKDPKLEQAHLVNGTKEETSEKSQIKPIVDPLDRLPELNLSESDSSDSEAEDTKSALKGLPDDEKTSLTAEMTPLNGVSDDKETMPVLETVWDNFKNYQASVEQRENVFSDIKTENSVKDDAEPDAEATPLSTAPDLETILRDHDYCTVSYENRTPGSAPCEKIVSSPDKKRSKRQSNSSSSSGSSSDSDSSCTCGSNCSCSSSSSSSDSSTDSSDSEATRTRKRERKERKQQQQQQQQQQPPCETEVPILETDLETEESETDEDFYDEHPQQLLKKLLQEKRNQLLMLVNDGQPVNNNNGSIVESSQVALASEEKPRRKKKSKKKKKKNSTSPKGLPLTPLVPKQIISLRSPLAKPVIIKPVLLPPTPSEMNDFRHDSLTGALGSGSETETGGNVRSSKRKRVPNKFYGYSSDEEPGKPSLQQQQPIPPLKWRKVDLPSAKGRVFGLQHQPITIARPSIPPPSLPTPPPPPPVRHLHPPPPQQYVPPITIRTTGLSNNRLSHTILNQDADNSDSDEDSDLSDYTPETPAPKPGSERVYCYCRCPYDEVSEMIACDGSNCAIEWFHFECVGIMVPPKGKWFCPDCRKQQTATRSDFV